LNVIDGRIFHIFILSVFFYLTSIVKSKKSKNFICNLRMYEKNECNFCIVHKKHLKWKQFHHTVAKALRQMQTKVFKGWKIKQNKLLGLAKFCIFVIG